jgi:hypothetical protein
MAMIGQQADHPSAALSGSEEPDGQAIDPIPKRSAGRSLRRGWQGLVSRCSMPLAQHSLSERVHHDLLASAGQVGELHAVVGEPSPALPRMPPADRYAMAWILYGTVRTRALRKASCSQLVGLAVKTGEDELGGSVDDHNEMGLTLERFGAHRCRGGSSRSRRP